MSPELSRRCASWGSRTHRPLPPLCACRVRAGGGSGHGLGPTDVWVSWIQWKELRPPAGPPRPWLLDANALHGHLPGLPCNRVAAAAGHPILGGIAAISPVRLRDLVLGCGRRLPAAPTVEPMRCFAAVS